MNGARDLHSRIWHTHAPAPRNNACELGVLTDGAYPKAIDCLPPAAQIAPKWYQKGKRECASCDCSLWPRRACSP
jgi:hypothetical protein